MQRRAAQLFFSFAEISTKLHLRFYVLRRSITTLTVVSGREPLLPLLLHIIIAVNMLPVAIFVFGSLISIVVLVGMKRHSIYDSSIGQASVNGFRRVSSTAKRYSESLIGLISKAYHAKSPEPDYSVVDFFSNPLKSHITEAVSAMRNPISNRQLIQAIRDLGHISVTGGNETSGYIGKFILPDLAAKLRNPEEIYEVKLASIEAVSEMCAYCVKDNQDLCKEYGILLLLLEGLSPHSNPRELLYRQWSAHALFYCIADHHENKRYVLNYNIWISLQNLAVYMHPDETMWDFNDAEMILEMLRR